MIRSKNKIKRLQSDLVSLYLRFEKSLIADKILEEMMVHFKLNWQNMI